ncbi:MAG: glycosyltransferase family 4 protein [Rhodothermia bacterium]|nr:MAG: glycosyltransferase family 4 protein [Rhodothermia bacterium]
MATSGADGPIALIGPHPPFRGGIAHFTERVGSGLQQAGRSVLFISFSRLYPGVLFPGRSQVEGDVVSDSDSEPISEPNCTIDSINPLSWARTAKFIVGKGARTAIFMYWMPFFAPPYRAIARRLRKRGVRIVGVVHNAIPHERHPGDRLLTRRFLRTCDSVIVLSESVGNDVRSLVPGATVRVQPHPVYDQFGEPIAGEAARKRLDIDESTKMLLFFGIVRPYKGLNVLLDALPSVLDEHSDTILVIAGEFYEDVENYRAQITRLNIENHVRVVDQYIPSGNVRDYFCAADVVVQPYTAATQSGVIAIARHFGVPVVATDTGGLAEAIGESGVAVPPGDSKELGNAIRTVLSSALAHIADVDRTPEREGASWINFAEALL